MFYFALLCFSCTDPKEQSNNTTGEDLINKEKSLWQAWKTHDPYAGMQGWLCSKGYLCPYILSSMPVCN
jgi:hypothetical protein